MSVPAVLSPEVLEVFPLDYSYAKEKILTLAQACSLAETVASIPLLTEGTEVQELLSTEIIWLGPKKAEKVLVLISATHGVEGYVGVAVQTDLLQRIQQDYQLPVDCAVMIIFALNPYGFKYARRCDEMGIDLNRNFIDFDKPLPANDGYEQLKDAIYCQDPEQRQTLFQDYRQRWGQTAFEIAISGGQYTDPHGPFFGGHTLAHGRKVIERLIDEYQLGQRYLAVIDIHSGLGPYAHGELINDHPLDSAGYRLANKWYGASVASPVVGDSSSVQKLGLLDFSWHPLMEKRGCFVTLEFGSYRTQDLFNVILEDHRSWKLGDQQAILKSSIAMKEHFCPQDSYWRELVLVKSRQVIQQALGGFQHV